MALTIEPIPESGAEADHDDGRHAFTVRLTARHAEFLCERAARHGDTPERHLETIVRQARQRDQAMQATPGSGTEPKGAAA
jgi:hypothetical protein